MNRLFRGQPLIVIAFCLLILLIALFWFDRQVAQPRFHAAQFSHYQAGDPIPFIVCWIEKIEKQEVIRVRDFRDKVVQATGIQDNLKEGSVLIMKGVMKENQMVEVEAIDYDPLFPFKAWGSFVAFLFILWNLWRTIQWTPQGFKLDLPDSGTRE